MAVDKPVFLHFGLTHILMNLALWWYLGGQVEKQLGSGRLLVITLISAPVSCWSQSFSAAHPSAACPAWFSR